MILALATMNEHAYKTHVSIHMHIEKSYLYTEAIGRSPLVYTSPPAQIVQS